MPRFKETHSPRRRKRESANIRTKNPDHIPIVVEPRSPREPSIPKTKYLIPKTLTMAQLQYVVRKNLSMKPEQAIFLICRGRSMPSTTTMVELYDQYRDEEDDFVYFTYTLENVFGVTHLLPRP